MSEATNSKFLDKELGIHTVYTHILKMKKYSNQQVSESAETTPNGLLIVTNKAFTLLQ